MTIITCPHCKQEFPLTEALSHEFEEKMGLQLKDKTSVTVTGTSLTVTGITVA